MLAYFMPTYKFNVLILLNLLVGTAGFEPATPCPPDKYATRLRYAPTHCVDDTTRPYYKSKAAFLTEFVWLFNMVCHDRTCRICLCGTTEFMAEVVE